MRKHSEILARQEHRRPVRVSRIAKLGGTRVRFPHSSFHDQWWPYQLHPEGMEERGISSGFGVFAGLDADDIIHVYLDQNDCLVGIELDEVR